MLTRIGSLVLLFSFALAASPLLAEAASSGRLSASEHAQGMTVKPDSSSITAYPNSGGICRGFNSNETCEAVTSSAEECCGMMIQCYSGNFAWGEAWFPYYGYPVQCLY